MSRLEANTGSVLARLWIYQAERFPLARTIPLLGAFSVASVSASARLAGRPLPDLGTYFAAFLIVLVFFWQLRVADEVKDADTDRRYRPERPIPRGLISLRLIVWLGLAASIPAIAAAYALSPYVIGLVAVVWGWLALMTVEFFAPALLHRSPLLYLVSHMAIMPLIDLVLTGCEWVPHGAMPVGLWTFLWMSLCNGSVVEFGRKIWAPNEEREGVETYSSAWGIDRSLLALALATLGAAIGLVSCGLILGRPIATGLIGLLVLVPFGFTLAQFRRMPDRRGQKRIETWSGLWVLACYLAAAFAPSIGGTP